MPTYEYECRACSHRFERRQRFEEAPIEVCPECGGATRRVLHPVGIVFKGSGWYVTDNRTDGRKGSNGKGESGESAGESKPAEAKGEKAEAKSEKGESKQPAAESGKKKD